MMAGRDLREIYGSFLRKHPKQSRSRAVVDAILEAASQMVTRGGAEDELAVEEIAERAGVGIGSFYDYFADRRSVLASVAAKLTSDNLHELEADLEKQADAPLEAAIEATIEHLFRRYLGDRSLPRAVLRIAHRVGLMPTLAESQSLFAERLGAALKKRRDVRARNVELTAFAMTNMTMGMIHTLLWLEQPPFTQVELRAELVTIWVHHLKLDEG